MSIFPRKVPWSRQPDRQSQPSRAGYGASVVFSYLPHYLANSANNDFPSITGSAPTKQINKFGVESKFTLSDALVYSADIGIDTSDFLLTFVLTTGALTESYEYILSGTTSTAADGIHAFVKHLTASGQWGIHQDNVARGSGNVLAANTTYILSVRRVGATVYFLQDGIPTSTASVTLSGIAANRKFLDAPFAVNQYHPTSGFRTTTGIGCISVLKGTFSEGDARVLSQNPWQIFKPQTRYIPIGAAGGGVTELTISDGIFMYDPDSRSLDAIKDEQFQFLDLLNKNHSAFHFENFLLNDFLSKDIAITALDKLLINDIFYKNVSLNLHDDLLLNDEIYKILESIIIDKLLLSDSSLQEIIAQNVISKIVTDYLDLSDSKLTEHDKTIFSSLFLNDFIKTIQDKIILDKLLLSDLSTQEISAAINVITKTVTDYLNLNDEDKKEYNKTIRNNLFLLENFIKLYEKRLDDSLFLYDSYTKAIIGAITEVLVFAKIQSINLLGESIEVEDNYLNVTTDIVSPD